MKIEARSWNGKTFDYFVIRGAEIAFGYKDKNGKLIYNGDIVIADWHWTKPHIISFPGDAYDMYEFAMDENCEIIGNIHNTSIDSEGDPII